MAARLYACHRISSVAVVSLAIVLALSPLAPAVADAQGISGASVVGWVRRGTDGVPLSDAVVELLNVGTGARRRTSTRTDGRFYFEDLPSGGIYQLSARSLGYESAPAERLELHLGDRVTRTIVMGAETARRLDPVVVRESSLRDAGAGGAAYSITGDLARSLPLLNRDFIGLFALAPEASGATLLSVSGQHNRFNAIQVDGGTQSDVFGTGITPGAGTGARALSLEAIEEIRILVAPFDVRQGGFSGGLINAVTRSGTNDVRGAVFSSFAAGSLVGRDTAGTAVPSFADLQYGGSIGGPVVRGRLHYFAVADVQARQTRYAVSPLSDPNTGIDAQAAERVTRAIRERYGFEPGAAVTPLLRQPNSNVFVKLSWQPTVNHLVELSQSWVNSSSDVVMRSSTRPDGWQLSGSGYEAATSTMTTRIRATSALGQWTNELVASAATIGDDIQSALAVPSFLVEVTPGHLLAAGSSLGTQGTATDQRILELTDNLSWTGGAHLVTVGTQNQIVRIRDNFMLRGWGVWTFPSVEALEMGVPSRYDVGLALRPDGPLMTYTGVQLAGYVQDRWSPTAALSVTGGLRIDAPFFDAPARNERLASSTTLRDADTGRFPSGNALVSPRLGVAWALGADRRTMLRGGVGAFAGRPPFAWLGNAYVGTGLEQTSLTCTVADGVPTPTTDIRALPRQCVQRSGQVPLARVNVFDPRFRFQQAVKYVIGIDRELGTDFTASLDLSHTRTRNHLYVSDANLEDRGPNAEGRETYGVAGGVPARLDPEFGAVYRFENRSAERSSALTAHLAKRWRSGGALQAGYTWSRTQDLMSLSGLTGMLLFQSNPLDGTIAERRLRRSARDIPHNLVVAGTLPIERGIIASVLLRVRSGTPYAYTVVGDANGDGTALNDLAYIPRDSSDISLANPEAYRALDAYIEGRTCLRSQRGRIMVRNSCRNPAVRSLDVRVGKRFASLVRGLELSLDVINLPNLLSRDWGLVRETTNREAIELLGVQGWDGVANRPLYVVRTIAGVPTLPRVDGVSTTDGSLASRWRVQLGARVEY